MSDEETIKIPERYPSKIEQRAFASGWRARRCGRLIRSNPLRPDYGSAWSAWSAWRAGWRTAGSLEELKLLRLKDEIDRRKQQLEATKKTRGATSTKRSGS